MLNTATSVHERVYPIIAPISPNPRYMNARTNTKLQIPMRIETSGANSIEPNAWNSRRGYEENYCAVIYSVPTINKDWISCPANFWSITGLRISNNPQTTIVDITTYRVVILIINRIFVVSFCIYSVIYRAPEMEKPKFANNTPNENTEIASDSRP